MGGSIAIDVCGAVTVFRSRYRFLAAFTPAEVGQTRRFGCPANSLIERSCRAGIRIAARLRIGWAQRGIAGLSTRTAIRSSRGPAGIRCGKFVRTTRIQAQDRREGQAKPPRRKSMVHSISPLRITGRLSVKRAESNHIESFGGVVKREVCPLEPSSIVPIASELELASDIAPSPLGTYPLRCVRRVVTKRPNLEFDVLSSRTYRVRSGKRMRFAPSSRPRHRSVYRNEPSRRLASETCAANDDIGKKEPPWPRPPT